MGFFENLGRKVGEFTQEAKESAAQEASYACEDCSERFYTERDECPACGSENVIEREPRSTDDGSGDHDDGANAGENDDDDGDPVAADETDAETATGAGDEAGSG